MIKAGMKLSVKSSISIPYNAPQSGFIQVKVAATEPVNVYAIRREQYELYKQKQTFESIAWSPLDTMHRLLFQLQPSTPWNLIVENQWEHEIEVNYIVTEMAKQKRR